MLQTVLPAYGLKDESLKVEAFGSGLINHTWKITASGKAYILQRVNNSVFKEPGNIANNISLIATHLKETHPDYRFIAPLATSGGEEMMYQLNEGFFRLFPFVQG